MTRAAGLLGVFAALSACTSVVAGGGSSSPAHAPADVVAAAADGGNVRWSITAASSNNKGGNDQKIAWSSAIDNGAGDSSIRVVCAFDAFRILVEWQLPHKVADALVKQSVRAKRRFNRANGQDNNDWGALIQSSLELVAVDVDGIVLSSVTASSTVKERSLSDALADKEAIESLLHKHYEQRYDGEAQERRELTCEFDQEFCSPSLVGIRLPDILSNDQSLETNHSIVLEFAQPTNQPIAKTKHDIDCYVRFTEYLGDEMTGQWSANGRILTIRVLSVDVVQLKPLKEMMHGLLQTSLRLRSSIPDSGESEGEPDAVSVVDTTVIMDQGRFRIEPQGLYFVRLRISNNELGHVLFTADSPQFRVVNCEKADEEEGVTTTALLRPSLPAIAASSSHPAKDPIVKPSFSLDGVVTLAGQEGFVLPHSAIHMQEPGSWSLSFWMLSTQDATEGFRSLFFNGDGTGNMRTPSAWWKPNENRLVLRVSTNASLDVGMDSEQLLPKDQWTHLGFSFRNCSRTSGIDVPQDGTDGISESPQCEDAHRAERPWFYSISFFVNGVKDKEVLFFAPALANSGPLYVGKGPWTDGMRGFISDLKVFPEAISEAQHHERYLQERDLHLTFPLEFFDREFEGDSEEIGGENGDSASQALLDGNPVDWSRPALQISYLVQRRIWRSSSGSKRNLDGDTLGLAVAAPSGAGGSAAAVESLQDQTYRKAKQILDGSCDRSGWDLLVEAAELGHAGALRDIGMAHLYGLYEFPDACAAADSPSSSFFTVKQDFELAREEFEAAIDGGAWDAGKYLVLLSVASPSVDNDAQNFTMGFYHLAAMAGRKDAFVALARRYSVSTSSSDNRVLNGRSSLETAVFHYYHAAVDASAAYHERGKQPLHEMNRLYNALKEDLAKGQLGDDDELIQFQKLRAEQGDMDAMAAMGDLYYWGARGMPRDHTQAYNYFASAAKAGHVSSQSALAGMLLKGEGAPQNNESAIYWYEQAAKRNHTRALNGLGFIHFYGNSGGVEKENKTLALEFFERAAANQEDGDSVFNTGYCHANGLGTNVNLTRAMHFYDIAARKFGHFDAIFEMGKLWMTGVEEVRSDDSSEGTVVNIVVERNPKLALVYLKAASDAGRWGEMRAKSL